MRPRSRQAGTGAAGHSNLPLRDETGVWPRLPPSLRLESPPARDWILRRVGVAKGWGWSSSLDSARSARAKAAVRPRAGQRVIVRHFVSIHSGERARPYRLLADHFRYLQRDGAGLGGSPAEFFDRNEDQVTTRGVAFSWRNDTRHYRLMISPEHGDCLADLRSYVREVMGEVSRDLSEPRLTWLGTCHFNTDHPHAHVVVRGRREDGAALLMSPKYLYHGVAARAREAATAQLGDFSRGDGERKIWQETKAEHFTGLDRRLIQSATEDGLVAPHAQSGPTWRALVRARLRTLAALGLAEPVGPNFRIAPDLQGHLTGLDISQAKLRTINQHRLVSGNLVHELAQGRLRGQVLQSGYHDRHQRLGYAILRDGRGDHYYARLAAGDAPAPVGMVVELTMGARGATRSAELDHSL